ncbi:hypothetical protein [Desulfatiglans anilini]|uniref:hypothetical protein n=1 Tax=Desulfatiglans anilini TaxID=90728 RepID=UPI0004815997|nr:hypothetical protein [Desulfatiglans anilini]
MNLAYAGALSYSIFIVRNHPEMIFLYDPVSNPERRIFCKYKGNRMIALRRTDFALYKHARGSTPRLSKKAISGRKPDRTGTTRERDHAYRVWKVFQKKAESSILSWNAILPAKPLFLTPK